MLTPKAHIPLQTGSPLVTNANEMSTNNMKYTWPTWKFCGGDPAQPIFHWLALGFCVGGNANFMFRFGGNANFSVFRYQHVGIPNMKFRVGVYANTRTQCECFRVAVEYRFKNRNFNPKCVGTKCGSEPAKHQTKKSRLEVDTTEWPLDVIPGPNVIFATLPNLPIKTHRSKFD